MTVLRCTGERRTESDDKEKLKSSLLFFDQDCSVFLFCFLFSDPAGAKILMFCD